MGRPPKFQFSPATEGGEQLEGLLAGDTGAGMSSEGQDSKAEKGRPWTS